MQLYGLACILICEIAFTDPQVTVFPLSGFVSHLESLKKLNDLDRLLVYETALDCIEVRVAKSLQTCFQIHNYHSYFQIGC